MADIYRQQGDFDSAYVAYMDLINKDSGDYKAYEALISILAENNKTEEIIALGKEVTDSSILPLFEEYMVVPPTFSVDEGTYEEYQIISLSAAKGCEIYYTTDGSDPVKKGKLYTSSIDLEELEEADSYVISAVCKNQKGIYSDSVTKKYKIDLQARICLRFHRMEEALPQQPLSPLRFRKAALHTIHGMVRSQASIVSSILL